MKNVSSRSYEMNVGVIDTVSLPPYYSLGRLMLKLKLQYFGHLMKTCLTGKYPNAGKKIEGKRKREKQRMRWLDYT